MTTAASRPWWVWGGGMLSVLVPFAVFAFITGWPTAVDGCYVDGCYCETIDIDAVNEGARGLRQPVNTLSNLYSIGTSALVAAILSRDRRRNERGGVIRSDSFIADIYVFAVLFLGLGSMWLHASIAKAVSWLDGLSMYVFAGFLVFYTLDRLLARKGAGATTRNLVFWIAYPATALGFTVIGAFGVQSVILIAVLVLVYVALEFWAGFLGWRDGAALGYWLGAVGAILVATVAWQVSKTGGIACWPGSVVQLHGMVWHTLAGVMAVLLYLYWRRESVMPYPDSRLTRPFVPPPVERWT